MVDDLSDFRKRQAFECFDCYRPAYVMVIAYIAYCLFLLSFLFIVYFCMYVLLFLRCHHYLVNKDVFNIICNKDRKPAWIEQKIVYSSWRNNCACNFHKNQFSQTAVKIGKSQFSTYYTRLRHQWCHWVNCVQAPVNQGQLSLSSLRGR